MTGIKKKLIIAGISVAALIVVAFIVLAGIYFFAPKSDPKYVAHRGYSRAYVGNTEEAFRAATEMSYWGIETDVQKTSDGKYVCNHDDTAKYADGDEKEVATSTFADLMSKPLKNDKTDTDVYLCTFETYLDVCKSGNKVAVIELKQDFDIEEVREIIEIVKAHYSLDGVCFISFYYDPLLLIREEEPTADMQYLSETKGDPVFDRCLEDKISISIRQSILTKKIVDTFHDAGLEVNTWTVNKKFDRNFVRLKGVDYITSDVFCEN